MDVLAHLQAVQMDVQFDYHHISIIPHCTAVLISTDILEFAFLVLVN